MANLGWGAPADAIVANAREVLEKAGVDKDQYSCLAPLGRTKGSAATLTFQSHEMLQKARRQADALSFPFCRAGSDEEGLARREEGTLGDAPRSVGA